VQQDLKEPKEQREPKVLQDLREHKEQREPKVLQGLREHKELLVVQVQVEHLEH
jgi:hypothetical protein